MQTITYEMALRALNEAVKKNGYGYIDPQAKIGETCQNVRRVVDEDGGLTDQWEPSCIVGTALVWLGVPVEWFPLNHCYCQSIERVAVALRVTGVLDLTSEALRLLVKVQNYQDQAMNWGAAVAAGHLGWEWLGSLAPREES